MDTGNADLARRQIETALDRMPLTNCDDLSDLGDPAYTHAILTDRRIAGDWSVHIGTYGRWLSLRIAFSISSTGTPHSQGGSAAQPPRNEPGVAKQLPRFSRSPDGIWTHATALPKTGEHAASRPRKAEPPPKRGFRSL
jgi:hypothetical protein